MLRTITVCERNITVRPPRVVTLVAATATEIFPNQQYERMIGEIVTRYVQNNTGGDLYLAFGVDAVDQANYHVRITDAQLFDCFPHRCKVVAWSAAGGAVSTTILDRVDLSH